MKYTELELVPNILRAIQDLGFEEPTTIQEKTIPIIRKGMDVIGQSETGSGKTAAFGIPILEKIDVTKGLQALVLAPTRELAEQIKKNLWQFSKYKRTNIINIYGGVGLNPQIHSIKSAHIIVGTPGRVYDHLRRGTLNLRNIRFLVLDEADKMFEMGFIDDVKQIIGYANKNRQTMMFSATINKGVHMIAERYMSHAHKIKANEYVSQQLLRQIMYQVRKHEKFSLLVHLINTEKPELAIVFCGTRREADFVSRNLVSNGINAMPLHGGLSQNQRNNIMQKMHASKIHILVATDIAARGLDIRNLSHIYNYNIPKTSKEYIHRIGRTARMGDKGIAINLLDERDHDNMRKILNDHSIRIENIYTPSFQRIQLPTFSQDSRNNRFRGNNYTSNRGKSSYRGHSSPYSNSRNYHE